LALAALVLLGAGRALPGPEEVDVEGVLDWLTSGDPLVRFAAAGRLGGLLLVGYLALLTVAGWLCRLAGLQGVGRVVVRLTLPAFRRAMAGAAGVTLTVLPLGGGALADPAPPTTADQAVTSGTDTPSSSTRPHGRVVMRVLDDGPTPTPPHQTTTSTSAAVPSPAPAERPIVVMRLLGDVSAVPPPTAPDAAPTAPTSAPDSSAPIELPGSEPVSPPVVDDTSTRTIEPGDHLWGVSEETLTNAWHRQPSDAEILDYLEHLIELNREVLVVPGHPDLVYPGQVFVLPPVTA
jgi:hypothetical protein